jgi:hypothetical protein
VIRPQRIAGALWQGNRTECRDWTKEKTAKGFTILTQANVETVKGMAMSLGQHPLIAGDGLLSGQIERSLFWIDQETGVWCKCRPDALPNDGGDCADLKTTKSVLWPDLVRTLDTAGYHQQGALIADGLKAVLDIEMQEFVLVFVEKKRPHCVRAPVHPDDIQRGRLLNRLALRKFADCWAAGKWPGPGDDDFNHLRLSDAARDRIDRRLEFEGMRIAA